MEATGTIIDILSEESGTTNSGKAWQKQTFAIETEGQYPKKIAIQVWGEKINDLAKFSIGDKITAHINIESREYNGKYYTDIKSYRLDRDSAVTTQATYTPVEPTYTPPAHTPMAETFNTTPAQPIEATEGEDDLPF